LGRIVVKHFDHDGIADGGTFEKEWTTDKAYKIHYIYFKRKDGYSFTKTEVTVWLEGEAITKPEALARTFGEDPLYALKLMYEIGAKQPVKWSGTNREGATIDIAVELILEEVE